MIEDRPLRIVALITHDDRGGAQEAILRLARHLRARGHEAEVWFLYGKTGCYQGEEGTRVLLPKGGSGPATYARIPPVLTRALAAHRPDVVVSFLPLANAMGQICARIAGVRCRIASQRNPGSSYGAVMRWADRLAGSLGFYDWNVGNSQAVLDSFGSYPRAYRRRLALVYNGIEWRPSPMTPAEARARFGLPEGEPLILNVGRLAAQKNQELLLRCLAQLPRGRLVLAGDGEDRADLEALARELGISARLHLLGEVEHADIRHLLRAVDLFAQPSRYEGQSNALLEAMHAGLAIVASDIPPQVETLMPAGGEPVGVLIPIDNASAWVAALDGLLREPDRRAALGARAQRHARRFTADGMAEGFECLMRKALVEACLSLPGN